MSKTKPSLKRRVIEGHRAGKSVALIARENGISADRVKLIHAKAVRDGIADACESSLLWDPRSQLSDTAIFALQKCGALTLRRCFRIDFDRLKAVAEPAIVGDIAKLLKECERQMLLAGVRRDLLIWLDR